MIDSILKIFRCIPEIIRNREIVRKVRMTRDLSIPGSRLAVVRGTSRVLVLHRKINNEWWSCSDLLGCCDGEFPRRSLELIDRDWDEDQQLRARISDIVKEGVESVLKSQYPNAVYDRSQTIQEMGGDSIDVMDIIVRIEDNLRVEIEECDKMDRVTPSEIERVLWEKLK